VVYGFESGQLGNGLHADGNLEFWRRSPPHWGGLATVRFRVALPGYRTFGLRWGLAGRCLSAAEEKLGRRDDFA
jgi:hypothetical protein